VSDFDLPDHPDASLFPMMPPDELDALAEDIKKHGQREPIYVHQGMVLDGRNRLKACRIAGVEPDFREWNGHGSPVDFVVSMNLHRRHLTSEQKRAVITAVLHATPAKSNRQVADQVRVDHKTVAAVRQQLEGTGEIPQLARRAGKDGKTRKVSPTPKAKRISLTPPPDPKADRITVSVYSSTPSDGKLTTAPAGQKPSSSPLKNWPSLRSHGAEAGQIAAELERLAKVKVADRSGSVDKIPLLINRLRQLADFIEKDLLP
jgi:hypothetical protein